VPGGPPTREGDRASWSKRFERLSLADIKRGERRFPIPGSKKICAGATQYHSKRGKKREMEMGGRACQIGTEKKSDGKGGEGKRLSNALPDRTLGRGGAVVGEKFT